MKIQKTIAIDKNLNEIRFSPKKLVNKDLNQTCLKQISDNFYPNLISGKSGVEDIENIRKRIDQIKTKYESQKIVLFSHGFLVRFWLGYNQYTTNVSGFSLLQSILQIKPIDFLEVNSV